MCVYVVAGDRRRAIKLVADHLIRNRGPKKHEKPSTNSSEYALTRDQASNIKRSMNHNS